MQKMHGSWSPRTHGYSYTHPVSTAGRSAAELILRLQVVSPPSDESVTQTPESRGAHVQPDSSQR